MRVYNSKHHLKVNIIIGIIHKHTDKLYNTRTLCQVSEFVTIICVRPEEYIRMLGYMNNTHQISSYYHFFDGFSIVNGN